LNLNQVMLAEEDRDGKGVVASLAKAWRFRWTM
jgi:hypothetical protein